jgi:hypothetical protein
MALIDAEKTALVLGHHCETVHSTARRLVLVEDTLTDGSKVMNLYFSEEGRHDETQELDQNQF